MSSQQKSVRYILFSLIFFTPFNIANAYQRLDNNLIEFSLSLRNQTTFFDFPTETLKVETDQVEINWYESFSSNFHGGLQFGYLDMQLQDNPLTSTQFNSGEYFGILLRFIPITRSFASLALNLNYRYNKTETSGSDQKSESLWHETLLTTELELRPFNKIGFVLAVEYLELSGKQRNLGNILQISPFIGAKHLGYRLGINFKPDPSADIRLEWFTGYSKGGQIRFIRKF